MFPGPTLMSAVTAIVESALNRALELDPAGKQAMTSALTGPVQFSFESVNLTLVLQQAGGRVQVAGQPAESPALVLSGRPMAFAALATGDGRVFSEGRIRVTGDTAMAHQFQRAIDQLDPDWEAAMAAYVGDVPAHFIGQRIRGALGWSRQAFTSLNANVEEYIHEESQSLPGRRELEATFTDIDRLALRTERLEARIEQLEKPNRSDQPETP
ncbi:SCP2 sterol-binding domain-containing protein [Marinobacter sp. TBZ242]|uniref:Ubiquinone biosynthesis accessory factor UbiJ n=1 Tax=Marinobacter azerbaijanicus TaxID=3050455 RepID=A0ABT7IAQ1_9GAMM|nr:SCP2 sterol-binding domain-containing protein [Marinobacter sp. TBZ242]MDL0431231.1 SCP2 sterol-binding domain-containing protein [Marinobacter sp. TBZ242]